METKLPVKISKSDLSLIDKINMIPDKPGVYQFKDLNGKVIYVGKAQNLRNRVRQYFNRIQSHDPKTSVMVSKIHDVEVTVTDNEVEALILESNLIKKLKPRYNVVLKDDKSYPFIAVTNEPYPRIFITRKRIFDAQYYGPYTDVKSVRYALKVIRDVFYVRSCNYDLTESTIAKKRFKVCLDYHMKKCEGPCEGFVSREHYSNLIDQAKRVLSGRIKALVEELRKDMATLADSGKYEEAAKLRDRIKALEVYSEKQKVVDRDEKNRDIIAIDYKGDDGCAVLFKVREGKLVHSQHIFLTNIIDQKESAILKTVLTRHYIDEYDIPEEIILSGKIEEEETIKSWLEGKCNHKVDIIVPEVREKTGILSMALSNAKLWLDELEMVRQKRGEHLPQSVTFLQKELGLSIPPRRIECFDVSNLQGKDNVASLVVFVDGKPRKSAYRKFKIRTVESPDDYASLEEVIERRYKRVLEEKGNLPDLIVIDGGKGQLSTAVGVLRRLELGTIPVIGLAKKLEEIFEPGKSEPIILPRTSLGLQLLQQIRNEAHRFAVQYHRIIRTKRIIRTELDKVEGIGEKMATKLLRAFGSIEGIKLASEEQLSSVVGRKLARKIKEFFKIS